MAEIGLGLALACRVSKTRLRARFCACSVCEKSGVYIFRVLSSPPFLYIDVIELDESNAKQQLTLNDSKLGSGSGSL